MNHARRLDRIAEHLPRSRQHVLSEVFLERAITLLEDDANRDAIEGIPMASIDRWVSEEISLLEDENARQ